MLSIGTMCPAGAPIPAAMRGRPLQDLLTGPAADWPAEVFLQISENHCGRAIRTGKWTYSVRAPGKTGHDADSDVYREDCLYDLERDPHQRNNLVAFPEHGSVRETLARILKRRLVAAGEKEPDILSFDGS